MKKYIIGICLCTIFFSSCSNWLNVDPKTTVKEEEVFSRELGFKEALTGVYIKMASTGLYGRDMTYGFIDILGRRYTPGSDDYLYYVYPSDKNENRVGSIWGEMYNIIANLNNILYYCDKNRHVFTTENYYEIIKGEALGLRAFLHFDLLRMYGPIYSEHPTLKRIAYRTEFNKDVQAMDPSSAVVDSVIADLKRAEALLADTDPLYFDFPTTTLEESNMAGDRFLVYRHKRMNLYAVKAMLARVYLYAGDKTEAGNYAKQVINSEQFELLNKDNDVLRSKEIIFSIYIDDFDQQVAKWMTTTSYTVNEEHLKLIFDVTHDGMNDFRLKEGVSFESTNSGMRMLKYNQDNKWPSTENTIVLIRLAEMYYILAECAATAEEAAGYLDVVRGVRGIDPVSDRSELNRLNEIEKEYRKEFYGEGQLFFFYKRHAYKSFLDQPMTNMTEDNYMFSWPDNEVLFGQTGK